MNPNDPNNPQVPPASPQPPAPAPAQPTPTIQTDQMFQPVHQPGPQFTPPPTQPYNPVGQPSPGMPMAPQPANKPNVLMLVAIGLGALLLIGGILFFIINGSSDKKEPSSSSSNSSSSSSSDVSDIDDDFDDSSLLDEEGEDDQKQPQQEIAVNKTFTTDTGITGTISKMVRHYDTSNADRGKEVVLVYVSEVSNGTYTNSVASYITYRMVDGSGQVYNEDSLNIGRNELTAAGYPLLYNAVKSGNNLGQGWLVFQVPSGSTGLSLRYIQKETKVLNGKTLPARNIDTVLVSQ